MLIDMIRQQMAAAVPFANYCSISLTAMADGTANATLPSKPELLNHIGSQHAAALFALGETASGGAMAGAFATMLLDVRPVVSDAKIVYEKVAKGPIKADAVTGRPGAELRAALETEGKVSFPIAVTLTNDADEVVARMMVEWHVSRKRT